jgi:proteasome lid subunit RPN8/RPN11
LSLLLKADDLAAIRRQAEADYPNETCGLLGGRWTDSTGGAHAGDHVKRVERLVPVANARHDSARNRYLIEPDAFRRAAQELERAGLDVIGVYHSHPDHPARPSDFDREHAWPRLSYIIVQVNAGRAGEASSWVLADDRTAFRRESIETEERTISWQSPS